MNKRWFFKVKHFSSVFFHSAGHLEHIIWILRKKKRKKSGSWGRVRTQSSDQKKVLYQLSHRDTHWVVSGLSVWSLHNSSSFPLSSSSSILVKEDRRWWWWGWYRIPTIRSRWLAIDFPSALVSELLRNAAYNYMDDLVLMSGMLSHCFFFGNRRHWIFFFCSRSSYKLASSNRFLK